MGFFSYEATVVPDSIWKRMDAGRRSKLKIALHSVTEVGLIAGCFDPVYWKFVVAWSVAHAILVTMLVGGRPMVFPAQLRIVYVAWVAIGTFVPHMTWMMYVTTVGLGANILAGWCPMSRMIYLFPWNRREGFDIGLPFRVFFSKPTAGRFTAAPPRA